MKGVILTYALCFGGSAAALFNPFVGLLVYIAFSIVKPDAMWSYSLPQGNYSRIVVIALLVGWAVKGFGNWQFGKARGIVLAFVAYWLWAILSMVNCASPDDAWPFVDGTGKILLPFIVGMTIIDSIAKLRILAWVIVISHGFFAFEMNMAYFSGFNAVRELGFAGLDNNGIACAMNACIGLAVFLGLYAERWWQKAVALASAVLMLHVVLFSFSRGGMLGLIITGAVSFIVIPKKPIYYVGLIVVVLIGLRLAGTEVRERFMTSFDKDGQLEGSAESRLALSRACFDVAIKNPVLGIGPLNWLLISQTYGFSSRKEAHTLWLQIAAEMGFVGLFFLVSFYGQCLVRLAGIIRLPLNPLDPWPRHIACMVIASLIGFAVSAQFLSIATLETPFYVTLLGAGVLKLTSLQAEADSIAADAFQMNPTMAANFR